MTIRGRALSILRHDDRLHQVTLLLHTLGTTSDVGTVISGLVQELV